MEEGTKERPYPWKGKNIVICCDGTGNQFVSQTCDEIGKDVGGNSNVVKLYTALRIDNEQVGYYHPGVGTAGDPAARNWAARKWSKLKGLAFASGFKDNVLDAYRYLMDTYNDGDRVYLFGFSRGSYTVRALAGVLDGYGLLCKGNQGHLPYAWADYVQQHGTRNVRKVETRYRFKETFSRKGFRIHFMGIWDTVSSVGWITTPLRLYSVAQNPTVRIGRHAISIDERRCFYRDNLWMPATEKQLQCVSSVEEPHPKQDLLEVWFPGVHSDVGGSYMQEESVLSNEALQWMFEQVDDADKKSDTDPTKVGLEVKPQLRALVLGEPVEKTGEMETDRKIDELKDLYAKPSCRKLHHSMHGPWWLLEVLPHRYYDKDDGQENWRTPLGMRRRIPTGTMKTPDGELIEQKAFFHPSAVRYMEQGWYRPENVEGGVSSLVPVTEKGQALYEYKPPTTQKPVRNETWVRWGVMVAVSALDVLALGLAVKGTGWLARKAWKAF